MYPPNFIKQVIQEAKKKSIMRAARKFAVAYTTVQKWLRQDSINLDRKQKDSQTKRDLLNNSEYNKPKEAITVSNIISKSVQFSKHCDSLQPFAKVAIKYIQLSHNTKTPKWLIVAFDLKTGSLNFCFTFENNKSNKALYLLYVNSFFHEHKLTISGFDSELQIDGININKDRIFDQLITSRIKRILSPLTVLVNNTTDIPELLTKSYLFLVDYNLSNNTEAFLHPPFMLNNNTTSIDFMNNTLMLKVLNEKVRSEILKVTCEYHQHKHQSSKYANDKLMAVYGFFKKKGIANRYLEEELVQKAANMQMMGELNNSDQLLNILLRNKELTIDGRNTLYLTYGQQKFHSGDHQKALYYYKKTVAGCKHSGNLQQKFSALRNICTFWLYQDKDNKAYRYLRMAQQAAFKSGDNQLLASYYHLSGHYYCARGKYKYSVQELEHALLYSRKVSDNEEYPRIAYAMANSLFQLKRYKEGLKFALQALSFFLKSGLTIPLCVCYRTCAECYFALNNMIEAETNLNTALELLTNLNYPVIEFTIRELYVRILLSSKRKSEAKTQFNWLQEFVTSNQDNSEVLKIFKAIEIKMHE